MCNWLTSQWMNTVGPSWCSLMIKWQVIINIQATVVYIFYANKGSQQVQRCALDIQSLTRTDHPIGVHLQMSSPFKCRYANHTLNVHLMNFYSCCCAKRTVSSFLVVSQWLQLVFVWTCWAHRTGSWTFLPLVDMDSLCSIIWHLCVRVQGAQKLTIWIISQIAAEQSIH